jgi:hypothetical protein
MAGHTEHGAHTMAHTVFDKAKRLINFATGEEYGDGYTVTDIIIGYAEPGYGDNDSVVVLGDWNPRHIPGADGAEYGVKGPDRWASTDPEVTMPVRLARSLERVGASIEWCDEWYRCGNCYRAVRATGDSYSWRPYYTMTDGEITCADCLRDMGDDALTEHINNPHSCITWCDASHVVSLGYVKWEAGDEHTYESGWHEGMDDNPQAIYDSIVAQYESDGKPAPDVVFFLDESSQFYIRFSAYVRDARNDDDADTWSCGTCGSEVESGQPCAH